MRAAQSPYWAVKVGIGAMLQSFTHKGLKELFETGKSRHVRPDLQKRCLQMLDALHHANSLSDLKLPGLRLHPDSRYKPRRWRIDVNGPWRITFEFEDGETRKIDLIQDH
jgi:proteic killer suppression protein